MSSGARGIVSASIAPVRMPRTSAAHSSSSSRVVANKRPSGFAPTQWPERPMRCSATAIERGVPSCTTRSTEPMSMPSSSDAVATTAFSSPRLSRSSASKRFSRERLPWCGSTTPSPRRAASWKAARSLMRRVLTNTSVVRWARTCSATRS